METNPIKITCANNVEVEVWANLISGNRHYICMKIKYFGQSLIIDLSEINEAPQNKPYSDYISESKSPKEIEELASCIAVFARRQDLQVE